ncbi:Autophagy protein Atg8 ubiquitin like/Ubiquitin-like autophagy protein Apg12 [Novymonas esmeraldas]|uniref:Autophagy-related protein n=1 Tax=Novymonas esmeraldas TaxID=1808958 RepID=A0AAW0EWJ0_9TRYP
MRRTSVASVSMTSFRDAHSEAERREEAAEGLSKGKIPIICERRIDSTLPDLARKKFLVSPTMRVGTFATLLQQRISQEVGEPFFLFIGDEVLKSGSTSTHDLYNSHKDADGFLYVYYGNEVSSDATRMGPYKSSHSAAERAAEAQEALCLHKIPIICERAEGSTLTDIAKKKFIVAPTMMVSHFTVLLKERIASEVADAFFLFLGDSVLAAGDLSMQDLYDNNKDRDGLLYVRYDNRAPEGAVRMGTYKATHPLAERRREAADGVAMGKIPIICEKKEKSSVPDLAKKKFIVAPTMSVGTFAALLHQRVTTEVDQHIHLFVADSVLTASTISMHDLYSSYKDAEDGYLYVYYSNEVPRMTPQIGHYKVSYTHAERMMEAEKALWLEKVPIICEKEDGATVPSITQRKFFVSREMTVNTFVAVLAERITQETQCQIQIFVRGDNITNLKEPVMDLYERAKDADKFLYVTYAS